MPDAALRDQITQQYFEKVSQYIRHHISNHHDAEDLAQEVFLKIWAKLNQFDETKASLSTWIYTITKNSVTDYYRNRKELSELPESLTVESIPHENELDGLTGALEALDQRKRDIILLRYYSGYTLKEIGERLGISYIYTKVLHKTALDELKKNLT